jgi:hypothetical protein
MSGVGTTEVRRLWQLIEPVHAVTYFEPAAEEAARSLGLNGFWAPYVVQRAAPLGPVGPEVVTATFFGFHPRRAAAVLPMAWDICSPAVVLRTREQGAVDSLGPLVDGAPVEELADLLWRAAETADCAGRALAAANAALPRPDDPLAALWQATTTLREHRGDGHVAACVSHGVTPVQAMQLKVAAGESEGEPLRLGRAWSTEAWEAEAQVLRDKGLVDDTGLTEAGRALRGAVEGATDLAATQPWQALDDHERTRTGELLAPLAAAVWAQGRMPPVNPIGLPPA